jgi:Trypsin.
LGRQQWNGNGGVVVLTSSKTVHSGYDSSTLQNDIALLRLPNPVEYTSEYPSHVSRMLCV